MVYSFDDAKAKSVHRTQYFEMLGNRAICNDGWVAATTPAILPGVVGTSVPVEDYKWELYNVAEGSAPDFKNKSYRITADVDIPAGGAEGMLLTQGGRFNGLGLYILKDKPVFYYNFVGVGRTPIAGKDALAPGKHTIQLDFKYDGGGIGKGGLATLTVDGKKVAEQRLTRTISFRVSADETLDIGEDAGTPVSEDYHVPFGFTGTLNKIVVTLGEAALTPEEQKQLDEQQGANELID